MHIRATRNALGSRRRGLAPLEMVLALPMLLFIMAAIANVGTFACWKIRALSIVRMGVWGGQDWRSRVALGGQPRSNAGDPVPAYWPPQTIPAPTGPTNLPDTVDDPRVDQPVARGPQIVNIPVNADLLDPTRGLFQGTAALTRNWPLMSKWPAYQLQATTCLQDDQWQYDTALMAMSSNTTQRVPILYTLPQAPVSLSNAYVQALMAIVNAPFQQQLTMLNPYSSYVQFPQQLCSADRADYTQPVQNLIDHIQGKVAPHVAGIAETMAKSYRAQYQSQLRRGGSSSQTATLQAWISQLTQFLASLQSG